MPSSTSSSDRQQKSPCGQRGVLAILGVVSLFLVGVELTSRYAVPRIDRGMRRDALEVKAVYEVRRRSDSARQVIVAGNSLLEDGIQFDEVRRSLRPAIDATRFVVEASNYYDWYYGLRKLSSDGVQPDVIVLMLTPGQLVASQIRTRSAYEMFRTRDIFRIASKLELSNTETSNLAFRNMSAYFGLGGEIRKSVIGKIFPDLPPLMALMTHNGHPAPWIADDVYSTATVRLRELRELAATWNSRIILVIPPSGEAKGDTIPQVVQAAGSTAGVPVLIPVAIGSLDAGYYKDGFHLNVRGAKILTPRFIEALRKEIIGD